MKAMKAKIIAALTLLVVATLGGCRGSSDSITTQGESRQAATPMGFSASYIRTDGYHEDVRYPVVTVITAQNQLEEYYTAHKDRYFLERQTSTAPNAALGFLDMADKYDDTYFEDHTLVLILTQESSGSVRYELTKVTQNSDAVDVTVRRDVPRTGTADMAQWHIFLELDKAQHKGAKVRVTFETQALG
ncbi:MAG TPA: hypothetical protein VFD23_03495 [Clostridia bacterium]|nr:hypothetical protein [Clostridia bacterium]